jgi:membrane protease YdiL (CAAX protease family)
MIDEAAKGHNPRAFGKIFLAVFLVYIISNAITNLVTTVPTTIYYLALAIQNGTYAEIEAAVLSGNTSLATSLLYSMMTTLPWWASLLQLLGGGVLFGAVIIYWKKFEKRKIASLGIRRGLIPLELLYGTLIGGALVLLTLTVALLTGTLKLSFGGFSFAVLLFPLGFLAFAAGEEILIHGLLMTSLARDIKPVFAVLISSLVFSLLGFSYTLDAMYFLNTFLFNKLYSNKNVNLVNLFNAIIYKQQHLLFHELKYNLIPITIFLLVILHPRI